MKIGIGRTSSKYAKGRYISFSSSVIRKIFERDKGICIYCGNFAQEIDHVIPVRDGGPSISGNGVCACRSCNNRKAQHPEDFGEYLTKAIFWLMYIGEDTSWMDDFYKET